MLAELPLPPEEPDWIVHLGAHGVPDGLQVVHGVHRLEPDVEIEAVRHQCAPSRTPVRPLAGRAARCRAPVAAPICVVFAIRARVSARTSATMSTSTSGLRSWSTTGGTASTTACGARAWGRSWEKATELMCSASGIVSPKRSITPTATVPAVVALGRGGRTFGGPNAARRRDARTTSMSDGGGATVCQGSPGRLD